jgi:hypothetical protein
MIKYSQYSTPVGLHPLQIEVTITAPNTTATLPLYSAAGYYHTFRVNYGDESGDKAVTTYNDADATHIYANAGIYILSITGLCESFHNEYGVTLKPLITRVISWGNTGIKRVGLSECTNLTSIPNDEYKAFSTVIYALNFCKDNVNLASIPPNIFKYMTINTDFRYIFNNCDALTEIPAGLFDTCVEALDFTLAFGNGQLGGAQITTIPDHLFDKCTKVTNFWGVFMYSEALTAIPPEIFKYNTEVTNMAQIFWGDRFIDHIPTGLFDTNTKVTNFWGTFTDIYNGNPPAHLFDNCPLATTFYRCFETCIHLDTIPAELFKYNTLVTNFERCFWEVSDLTLIPTGLFDTCTEVTNFKEVFSWNNYITSIPAGLFANCTKVIYFDGAFSYCTGLTSIPINLFANCPLVISYALAFQGDTALTGNAPALWDLDPEPTGTECFHGATGLTNYAAIPADWK